MIDTEGSIYMTNLELEHDNKPSEELIDSVRKMIAGNFSTCIVTEDPNAVMYKDNHKIQGHMFTVVSDQIRNLSDRLDSIKSAVNVDTEGRYNVSYAAYGDPYPEVRSRKLTCPIYIMVHSHMGD